VTTGRIDCRWQTASSRISNGSIGGTGPSLSAVIAPSSAAARYGANRRVPVVGGPPVRGMTDQEIRFGIAHRFPALPRSLGAR